MTFNFLGPGLTVNVEAKVKEQIILDSSALFLRIKTSVAIKGILSNFKTNSKLVATQQKRLEALLTDYLYKFTANRPSVCLDFFSQLPVR